VRLLEFEIAKADGAIRGSIIGRVAPIDPYCTLRRLFHTIKPLIVVQKGADLLGVNRSEASRLRMQKTVSLQVRIRADGSPVRQGLATVNKRATTSTGTACLSLGWQITESRKFLAWMIGVRIFDTWPPVRGHHQDTPKGIELAEIIHVEPLHTLEHLL
jgi:hypothetical protein